MKTVTGPDGKAREIRRYAAPDEADLRREARVLALLRERFAEWQRQGFIPSKPIISGYNTDQPIRERGWTHWHHLFTPASSSPTAFSRRFPIGMAESKEAKVACLLGARENLRTGAQDFAYGTSVLQTRRANNVFLNQALNTLFNYSYRPLSMLPRSWTTPAICQVQRMAFIR